MAGVVSALFSTDPAMAYGDVFSTFSGDDAAGMRLSLYTSADALNFTLLSNTGFGGSSGYIRDPSIMKHVDGMYYVAYTDPLTDNCCGKEDHFSIAKSRPRKSTRGPPPTTTPRPAASPTRRRSSRVRRSRGPSGPRSTGRRSFKGRPMGCPTTRSPRRSASERPSCAVACSERVRDSARGSPRCERDVELPDLTDRAHRELAGRLLAEELEARTFGGRTQIVDVNAGQLGGAPSESRG